MVLNIYKWYCLTYKQKNQTLIKFYLSKCAMVYCNLIQALKWNISNKKKQSPPFIFLCIILYTFHWLSKLVFLLPQIFITLKISTSFCTGCVCRIYLRTRGPLYILMSEKCSCSQIEKNCCPMASYFPRLAELTDWERLKTEFSS